MTKAEYLAQYPPLPAEMVETVDCAMDASVLSGVVQSWSEWVQVICRQAHQLGHGTDWVSQHPINVVVCDKLAQLATRRSIDLAAEHGIDPLWAYDWLAQRRQIGAGT